MGRSAVDGSLSDPETRGPGVVNAAAGMRRWHFSPGRGAVSAPAVADGGVYVGNASEVYAVDAVTGQPWWRFSTALARIDTTPPAVVDGTVFIGTDDEAGHVYARDARTGRHIWKASTGAPVSSSSPAVVDGVVYVGNQKGLYALDAASGERRWEFRPCAVFARPAVADGVLYVHAGGRDGGGLYAVDARTGEQ